VDELSEAREGHEASDANEAKRRAGPSFAEIVLAIGLGVATILLARFAYDFARRMHPLLGIPGALLAMGAIVACGATMFGKSGESPRDKRIVAASLFAIPCGFIASALDCAGLSIEGCGWGVREVAFCTIVKVGILPAMLVLGTAWAITKRRWILGLVVIVGMVTLVPHCVCRNPVNVWWIETLGASPMCFGWGFVNTVLSVGVLSGRGRRAGMLLSLGVSYASAGGSFAFFIGHHYFHFPW
jgi:hypothetical protein